MTDDAPPVPENAPKKIVIIGAGIAGLSCGCYLQMCGVETEILEAGALPGGLCTSWHRGDYTFDGCMRWLIGAQEPSVFHEIWDHLGAIHGKKVFIHDEMLRIEGLGEKTIIVFTNLDKLAVELKNLAPEDSALIDKLIRDARRLSVLEPPMEKPVELMRIPEKMRLGLRYLPLMPAIMRYKSVHLPQYIARFKNARLREVFRLIVGNDDMSALVLVMLLAFRTRNNTGFVAGGSWDFAMAIADRYKKLGGTLRLKTRVEKIEVENNRATGVRLDNEKIVPAATVVSCADGYTTIFKMLGGKFLNRRIKFLYEHCKTFPPIVQISLGIRKIFPDAPHTLNLPLAEPIAVDNQTKHSRLEVEVFGSESELCPAGCTEMTVRLQTRFDFWTELKKSDVQKYRAEKKRLIAEITAALDRRFPGLAENVEQADVATPATFVRYTGNWQGSYEGWLPTPGILGKPISYTLPRLKNFYMAGHWVVAGGGLPASALAGRYAAQMVCAQHGKKFTPSAP
jgi:phytoene dehydrogenase-like protein